MGTTQAKRCSKKYLKLNLVVNDFKAFKQNELNTLINLYYRRILSNDMGIIIKT